MNLTEDKIPTRRKGKNIVLDLIASLGLGLAALLLFWPFRARYLYNWDSIQFSLALKNFSVVDHTPHPPGYPLYVLTGKIFGLFLPEANAAFVAVSLFFAFLTVVLFYYLGRQFFSCRQSVALTILYTTCPVFWGNSVVALSYTAEGFFGLALAWLGWRIIRAVQDQDDKWPAWLMAAAAVFAAALGYRQGLVLYFLPLYAYVFYRLWRAPALKAGSKLSWALIAAAIFVGLTGLWLWPFLKLASGWQKYLEAVSLQSRIVIWPNTAFGGGFAALRLNLEIILAVLFYSLSLGWVVLSFFVFKKNVLKAAGRTERGRFFLLWIVPALLFFSFIYIQRSGYLLVILPAFYLLLGLAWRRFYRGQKAALWLILLAANLYCFLSVSQAPLSAGEIRLHDRMTAGRVSLVRENFPPTQTMVLASDDFNDGWRQAMYYLPEYRVVRHGWLAKGSPAGLPGSYYLSTLNHPRYRIQEGYQRQSRYLTGLAVPSPAKYLVIWDKNMADYCLNQAALKTLSTTDQPGPEIWYLFLAGQTAKILLVPPYYFIFLD